MNNEAESKEAQELFFELGYEWNGSGKEVVSWRLGLLFTKDFQGKNCLCYFDKDEDVMLDGWVGKELTLPKLRDLVVLHRNDVRDANWVTEGDDQIYKDSNGKSFIFREQGWDELQRHEMRQAMWEKVKSKQKSSEIEQGLISGADAKLAWAKGENVQFRDEFDKWYQDWTDLKDKKNGFWITDFDLPNHQFRLKPSTIKLSLEIPAPFEPKLGETYYFIATSNSQGFDFTEFEDSDGDELYMQLGAYRNASDASKAFEALRGGIKG